MSDVGDALQAVEDGWAGYAEAETLAEALAFRSGQLDASREIVADHRREIDALKAHIAELERTAASGGIPPRYTSPAVLRGYVTGERL